jgi:hypothetical protein
VGLLEDWSRGASSELRDDSFILLLDSFLNGKGQMGCGLVGDNLHSGAARPLGAKHGAISRFWRGRGGLAGGDIYGGVSRGLRSQDMTWSND